MPEGAGRRRPAKAEAPTVTADAPRQHLRRGNAGFGAVLAAAAVCALLLIPQRQAAPPAARARKERVTPLRRPAVPDPPAPPRRGARTDDTGVQSAAAGSFGYAGSGRGAKAGLPIGDGVSAGLAWVGDGGTLKVLLSRSDAIDEGGNLFKLGTLSVSAPGLPHPRQQRIDLPTATFEADAAGGCNVTWRAWYAGGRNVSMPSVLVVEAARSGTCDGGDWQVQYTPPRRSPEPYPADWQRGYCGRTPSLPVPSVSTSSDAVAFRFQNGRSIAETSLSRQGLAGAPVSDPLSMHVVEGRLQVPGGRCGASTCRVAGDVRVAVSVVSGVVSAAAPDVGSLRAEHGRWWRAKWRQSWISVPGAPRLQAQQVRDRYLTLLQGRGVWPIKFNGGLFTSDDGRRWGGWYWWQNTRLMYLPALMSGDADSVMQSLYWLYDRCLPTAVHRSQAWWHGGAGLGADPSAGPSAFFPEIMTAWCSHTDGGWGYGCPDTRTSKGVGEGVPSNAHTRMLVSGGLELLWLLLTHGATVAAGRLRTAGGGRARTAPTLCSAALPLPSSATTQRVSAEKGTC
eukprot:TRINITY_DN14603_c0_g1_i1.p1 TRINITY_DN14603_c0_g1~~TRINITY_DN14603_c0_g1_i1.p1  ORF type:complete len:566 (+),score=98.76 TRINITY_DN14603_c0_g1_i1:65-1762(+)